MRKLLSLTVGLLLFGGACVGNPGFTVGCLLRPDIFATGYWNPPAGYGDFGYLWLQLGYDSGGPGVKYPWFTAVNIQFPFVLAGGYQLDGGIAIPLNEVLRIPVGVSIGAWVEQMRPWSGFWGPFVGIDLQLGTGLTAYARITAPMLVYEWDDFLGVWISLGFSFKPWDWVKQAQVEPVG